MLLLVILSILVLFSVVAVTFALVSSQFRRSSVVQTRIDQYAVDYRDQLDDAAKQVFRGSKNPQSVVSIHSLLEDMYGYDGLTNVPPMVTASPGVSYCNVQIASAQTNTATTPAQFLDIFLTPNSNPFAGQTTLGNTNISGYFNGCVLTMLSGQLAGKSTRIVGYDSGVTSGTAALRVMSFEGTGVTPSASDTFIINGRAFNGTGFGYNTTTLGVDAKDANSRYAALLPNAKFFLATATGTYASAGGVGGADEDYDGADPQNMALAYLARSVQPSVSGDILPSFHRPELIQYWTAQTSAPTWTDVKIAGMFTSSGTAQPSVLQQTMLRPFGGGSSVDANGIPCYTGASVNTYADHPYFTGSNPLFDPVNGPWDVDTDGDALADSVWVDLGSPAQTAPDGTTYKPLYAIMCLDLDGRLNVNAHGNAAQAQAAYTNPPTGPFPNPAATTPVYTTTNPSQLTYGSGYGPADINLAAANALFSATGYQTFFTGSSPYESRYGELGGTPAPLQGTPAFLPGRTTAANSADDLLSLVKHYNYPTNYYTQNPFMEFGQPSDLWGRMAVGLDYRGQPVFAYAGYSGASLGTGPNETPNNPYALNLSQSRVRNALSTGAVDNPFSLAELERILRYPDLDATTLPDRLRSLLNLNLTPGAIAPPAVPYIVTTDSFDLPSPSVLPTTEMRTLLKANAAASKSPSTGTGLGLADLVAAKFAANSPPTTPTSADLSDPANYSNAGTNFSSLLWPEFLAGVRFDVNRPFGNGRDDNGNNVVDEPEEYGVNNEQAWSGVFPPGGAAVQFARDYNGDGSITAIDANLARHYYARHLYVLMMLFMDSNYPGWSTETGIAASTKKELMTRRIAQWAINCVDFRDADSIMTPFEYDANPFTKASGDTYAWAVDGNPATAETSTDRRLIWGAEYPDLLLTETGAFHDRRVRDTANDTGTNTKRGPSPLDATLDQIRIPQGSLFVELYCARNGNNPYYPGDLYTQSGGQWGLDLGRMSPANSTGLQYPVWRLAITASTVASAANNINTRIGTSNPDTTSLDPHASADPFHLSVFDPANAVGQVTIERIAWLAAPTPAQISSASTEDYAKIFYNQAGAGSQVLLAPGNYAALGPRPTTYVGLQTVAGTAPAPSPYSLQDITITPNVSVVPPSGTSTYPNNTTIKTPLGIVCAAPAPSTWVNTAQTAPNGIGLNISEPLPSAIPYYPEPSSLRDPTAAFNAASNPLDSYGQEGNSAKKFPDQPMEFLPVVTGVINSPIVQDNILSTQTKFNYKTILLQRLADPLAAYNPPPPSANYNSNLPINPYVTVDWQPVDLTVFNGEASIAAPLDTMDPAYSPGTPNGLNFGTRQRGSGGTPGNLNLFSVTPQTQPQPSIKAASSSVFDLQFTNTIGYLNTTYGAPWSTTATPPAPTYYKGDPQPSPQIFPWLVWNNRPFVSPLEMMNVPASSPSRLTFEFVLWPGAALSPSPYDTSLAPPTPFQIPYYHLLNFFLAGPQGTPGAALSGTAPQLYRIFDYLHVPSRFVGTETLLSPATFTNAAANATLTGPFFPPFNKVSNYRDPGRVNINTVSSGTTWSCVLNGIIGPQWSQIVASRSQGYAAAPSTFPTRFTNPFRCAAGADLTLPGLPLRKGIEVGLLRPDPYTPAQPLFDFPAPPAGSSLGTPTTAPLYNDPIHASAFRYQTLNRLSNLLTTRSNVYAVWITVGYFQVKPWYGLSAPLSNTPSSPAPNLSGAVTPDAAHPDGLQLGPEVGSDTGDIKRHRAFYIFDRSIPVGFQRGEDYNVDDAVRLRRFIE